LHGRGCLLQYYDFLRQKLFVFRKKAAGRGDFLGRASARAQPARRPGCPLLLGLRRTGTANRKAASSHCQPAFSGPCTGAAAPRTAPIPRADGSAALRRLLMRLRCASPPFDAAPLRFAAF